MSAHSKDVTRLHVLYSICHLHSFPPVQYHRLIPTAMYLAYVFSPYIKNTWMNYFVEESMNVILQNSSSKYCTRWEDKPRSVLHTLKKWDENLCFFVTVVFCSYTSGETPAQMLQMTWEWKHFHYKWTNSSAVTAYFVLAPYILWVKEMQCLFLQEVIHEVLMRGFVFFVVILVMLSCSVSYKQSHFVNNLIHYLQSCL